MIEKQILKGLDEASLHSNPLWTGIDGVFRCDGLPGITVKYEVGGHDLYLKTAWYGQYIVRVDVTLSRGQDADDSLPKTPHMVNLETTRYDQARSWIESECRMASDLLQSGVVDINTIINGWIGVEGYPNGYCPQIPSSDFDGNSGPTYQKGPLHAAAMIIRSNLERWTGFMGECVDVI